MRWLISPIGVGRFIMGEVENVPVGVNRPGEAQEAAIGVWGHASQEKI